MKIACCHSFKRLGDAYPEKGAFYWVDFDGVSQGDKDFVRESLSLPSELRRKHTASYIRSTFGAGKRVTILVHGYLNRDIVEVHDAYRTIYGGLSAAWEKNDGTEHTVIGFLWPSKGFPLSYEDDQSTARRVSIRLKNLVSAFHVRGWDVNLLCHSMGNYLASDMLDHVNSDHALRSSRKPYISKFVMQAPDVAQDAYAAGGAYRDDASITGGYLVQWSSNDTVLAVSEVQNRAQRLGRRGPPPSRPANMSGEDCSVVEGREIGHGDYKNAIAIQRSAARFLG